eukprot:COSAG01_NODE_788_length_13597_cov_35.303601_5_plen_180_part_00
MTVLLLRLPRLLRRPRVVWWGLNMWVSIGGARGHHRSHRASGGKGSSSVWAGSVPAGGAGWRRAVHMQAHHRTHLALGRGCALAARSRPGCVHRAMHTVIICPAAPPPRIVITVTISSISTIIIIIGINLSLIIALSLISLIIIIIIISPRPSPPHARCLWAAAENVRRRATDCAAAPT